MVEKYGKDINMLKLNRNLSRIKQVISDAKSEAERSFQHSNDKNTCRICGSTEKKFFYSVYKYDYYECMSCHSIYIKNLPDLSKLYTGEADDHANETEYIDDRAFYDRVEMIAKPKIDWILEVCENEGIEVGSWLDIGCGGGDILYYIKNLGMAGEGIESDIRECRYAEAKGLCIHDGMIDINQKNDDISKIIQSKDVVSFFNFLEHVPEPKGFIEYVSQNMKKGKVMVFEVPRHPSVASFANLMFPEYVYRHIAPPHISIFSESGIEKILGNEFEIVGKWCFGQGYMDIINNSMLAANATENDLYYKLSQLHNLVQPVFDREGYADVIIIVAVKK